MMMGRRCPFPLPSPVPHIDVGLGHPVSVEDLLGALEQLLGHEAVETGDDDCKPAHQGSGVISHQQPLVKRRERIDKAM